MARGRADPSAWRRAQAPLVGIVLLIGMAATISVGFMLVATEATSTVQEQSDGERLETSFVQLSQELSTTTTAESSRTIDFDLRGGEALVREETGTISISSDGLTGAGIDELTIGSIEYEHSDGTVFAYEGGAVFKHTEHGTKVLSPPAIYYEHRTQTLTMPVVTTVGDDHIGSGDVRLAKSDIRSFHDANVVENDSVTITIESEFYQGWASFFRTQAGDTSVRSVDHGNTTVEVEVGYADIQNAFDTGVTYGTAVDDFQDEFEGESRQGSMPPMDKVIEDLRRETATDPDGTDMGTITGGEQFTGGLYYADEVRLESGTPVTANLSKNATLLVDGDVLIDDSNAEWLVDPQGTDSVMRIYLTGNFEFRNGEMKPDPSVGTPMAHHLQVYGTSQLDGHFHDGYFHGTFYAASDDWEAPNEVSNQCDGGDSQVCFHSNPEFEGALVAHSTDIHAAAASFTYDDSLEERTFDAYPDGYTPPPQLTYLNVAQYEISVGS